MNNSISKKQTKLSKLIKIILIIAAVLGAIFLLVISGFWLDEKIRIKKAYDELGTNPLMSKNLLGMKLKEQYIRPEGCSMGKCNGPEITNTYYFPEDKTWQELSKQVQQKLKDDGWMIDEEACNFDEVEDYVYLYYVKSNVLSRITIYKDNKRDINIHSERVFK